MTGLQKQFLLYTFIYFLIKGGLYVGLYIATIIAEKRARERHAMLKEYLNIKRANESIRWKKAYELYERKFKRP